MKSSLIFSTLSLAAVVLVVACDTSSVAPVILFDRQAASVTHHPFPDDIYRNFATGRITQFTEEQVDNAFYLNLMETSVLGGYSVTTPVRIPYAQPFDADETRIDPASVLGGGSSPPGIVIYRVDDDTDPTNGLLSSATQVDIGEVRVTDSSVIVRPAVPLQADSRYAVLVRNDLRGLNDNRAVASANFVFALTGVSAQPEFSLALAGESSAGRPITAAEVSEKVIAFFTFSVSPKLDPTSAALVPEVEVGGLLGEYVNGNLPFDDGMPPEFADVGEFESGDPLGGEIWAGNGTAIAEDGGVSPTNPAACLTSAQILSTPCTVADFYTALGVALGLDQSTAATIGMQADAAIERIVVGMLSTPNFIGQYITDPTILNSAVKDPDQAALLFTSGAIAPDDPAAAIQPDPMGPDFNPVVLNAATPYSVIPFLTVVPESAGPPPNLGDVLLFAHGLTRSKEDALVLAPMAAASGYTVIAIDAYQHGARQTPADLMDFSRNLPKAGTVFFGTNELSNGDFSDKTDPMVAALGLPGFPDPFINLVFAQRFRDRMLQTMVDWLSVIRLVEEADGSEDMNDADGDQLIDFDGDGMEDDWDRVTLVGHSLGANIGAMVTTIATTANFSVLNVPGGGWASIIRESPSLSSDLDMLLNGVAQAPSIGLVAGSETFEGGPFTQSADRETYDIVLQNVVSPADPLAYTGTMHAKLFQADAMAEARALMQFVLDDDVIPNAANARLARGLMSAVNPLGPLPDADFITKAVGTFTGATDAFPLEDPFPSTLTDISGDMDPDGVNLTAMAPFTLINPTTGAAAETPFELTTLTQFAGATHGALIDPTDTFNQSVQLQAIGFIGESGDPAVVFPNPANPMETLLGDQGLY